MAGSCSPHNSNAPNPRARYQTGQKGANGSHSLSLLPAVPTTSWRQATNSLFSPVDRRGLYWVLGGGYWQGSGANRKGPRLGLGGPDAGTARGGRARFLIEGFGISVSSEIMEPTRLSWREARGRSLSTLHGVATAGPAGRGRLEGALGGCWGFVFTLSLVVFLPFFVENFISVTAPAQTFKFLWVFLWIFPRTREFDGKNHGSVALPPPPAPSSIPEDGEETSPCVFWKKIPFLHPVPRS